MKLNDTQIRALKFLTSIIPGDPILDTALALAEKGDLPEVPTLTAAIVNRTEDAIKFLSTLTALNAAAPSKPKVEGLTAPEKIVAWLKAEQGTLPSPKKHAPGVVNDALGMPKGTFGEALKGLRDSGTVMAEGQGAGRRIWLNPAAK